MHIFENGAFVQGFQNLVLMGQSLPICLLARMTWDGFLFVIFLSDTVAERQTR